MVVYVLISLPPHVRMHVVMFLSLQHLARLVTQLPSCWLLLLVLRLMLPMSHVFPLVPEPPLEGVV